LLHRILVGIGIYFGGSISFSTTQSLISVRPYIAILLDYIDTKNYIRVGIANIASNICSVLIGELSNSLLVILEKDLLLNKISSDQFAY